MVSSRPEKECKGKKKGTAQKSLVMIVQKLEGEYCSKRPNYKAER